MIGDFADRKPCGVVRFNHVDTALLQEANSWEEKEWLEGPRSAWHLNCLVSSVAMAVRGKQPTNRSHATREGNQTIRRDSKRQEGHISDKKAKGLRLRDCLPGWMWK